MSRTLRSVALGGPRGSAHIPARNGVPPAEVGFGHFQSSGGRGLPLPSNEAMELLIVLAAYVFGSAGAFVVVRVKE